MPCFQHSLFVYHFDISTNGIHYCVKTICIHSNELTLYAFIQMNKKIKYPDDSDMIKDVDLSKFLCLTVNFSFEGTYLKLSIFHSEEILGLFFFLYRFYINIVHRHVNFNEREWQNRFLGQLFCR